MSSGKLLYSRAISRGDICKLCECIIDEKPCVVCVTNHFRCWGSCSCCQGFRNHSRKEIIQSSDGSLRDGCLCNNCKKSHSVCSCLRFQCGCSCKCCEDALNDRAGGASDVAKGYSDDSQNLEAEDRFCKGCLCEKGKSPCLICHKKMEFKCLGTCTCCVAHRRDMEAQKYSEGKKSKKNHRKDKSRNHVDDE